MNGEYVRPAGSEAASDYSVLLHLQRCAETTMGAARIHIRAIGNATRAGTQDVRTVLFNSRCCITRASPKLEQAAAQPEFRLQPAWGNTTPNMQWSLRYL